jgi:hypothetical protein
MPSGAEVLRKRTIRGEPALRMPPALHPYMRYARWRVKLSMGGGCVWAVADIGNIRIDRVGMHYHSHNAGDHRS